MSQEKLQPMVMQKFWEVIEVHYGIVPVVNWRLVKLIYLTTFLISQNSEATLRYLSTLVHEENFG